MKKLLLGLMIFGSPLFASAEETVSAADQATIYLNAAENNAFGLIQKLNGNAQYYACKDAQILKLTMKALSVDSVNKEAVKVNPWVLRNLGMSTDEIDTLVTLCEGQLSAEEMPEAKKAAKQIADNMSME